MHRVIESDEEVLDVQDSQILSDEHPPIHKEVSPTLASRCVNDTAMFLLTRYLGWFAKVWDLGRETAM
jgi:hypothetical protein